MEEKDLFDLISKRYDLKDHYIVSSRARKARLLSSISYNDFFNKDILEIGCGAGHSLKYIPNTFKSFTGIDFSDKLIELARKNYSGEQSNVCFYPLSAEDFASATSEKFDLIFMIGVLHHISEIDNFLNSLKSLCHKDSIIVFNEPTSGNLLISILRKLRKKVDLSYSDNQIFFTTHQLEKFFANSEFTIIELKNQGFLSTPFAEVMLRPAIIFYPICLIALLIDSIMSKLPYTLTKLFCWNTVIKIRSNL